MTFQYRLTAFSMRCLLNSKLRSVLTHREYSVHTHTDDMSVMVCVEPENVWTAKHIQLSRSHNRTRIRLLLFCFRNSYVCEVWMCVSVCVSVICLNIYVGAKQQFAIRIHIERRSSQGCPTIWTPYIRSTSWFYFFCFYFIWNCQRIANTLSDEDI